MATPINNSLLFGDNKDSLYLSQLNTLHEYLKLNIATGSMASVATGIPHKCITWYKKMLEENGHLKVVGRKACEITGCMADYLTCNPDWFPHVQFQVNLFDGLEGYTNVN